MPRFLCVLFQIHTISDVAPIHLDLLWTVPWLHLYVYIRQVLCHLWYTNTCFGSRQRSYTVWWKFPELKPTDMHSVSPVWRMVVIYYLVCSRLLHCKRIFPNSKGKHIVYLQMFVDQYLLNDMWQILINNIKIRMNVRCAEMTSNEITNLTTMLVEVQNDKTFYEKNM